MLSMRDTDGRAIFFQILVKITKIWSRWQFKLVMWQIFGKKYQNLVALPIFGKIYQK